MNKTQIAKKLLSRKEEKEGVSKFTSKAWVARKEAIAQRVAKQGIKKTK